ncbi:MAG: arylsulfatase [Cyclobacteriaceae bacterium]
MKNIFIATILGIIGHYQNVFAQDKPNIVIILADDLGYGEISCQNEKALVATPQIDKLAQNGIRFRDGHAAASVCTPARYALLAGQYCWRTQLQADVLKPYEEALISEETLTLPEMLKQNGYKTAMIGKWHLGLNYHLKKPGLNQHGSTKNKFAKAMSIDWTKPIGGGPVDHGFDWYWGENVINYGPFTFIENRHVVTPPTVVQDGKLTASDWDETMVLPTNTKKAVEYIHKNSKLDKPFFLYFSMCSPHTPHVPTDMFKGESGIGNYGDYIMETDWSIGQVVQAISDAGIANNTMIILTSDNGPEKHVYNLAVKHPGYHSAGPLRGVKRDLWEGGHRVPFIVSWPDRIQGPKISDQTITQVDVMASLADLIGAKLNSGNSVDSYSVLPALLGGKTDRSLKFPILHHRRDKFAIRQGDWLFIDYRTGNMNKPNDPMEFESLRKYEKSDYLGGLYNLKEDIDERFNLYNNYPEKVEELRELLLKLKTSSSTVRR